MLDFINDIEDSELSVFSYHYLYNGGGVGIADFNNDGFKDIFLGGNMVSSVLIQGQGNLNFLDVTKSANVSTTDWINGVGLVDLNHDGLMDIYLSVGGPNCTDQNCKNLLFINKSQGQNIKFEEQASLYGLDLAFYSQQGLFFDADLDGDLDLYLVQNYVDPTTKNYPKPKQYYSEKSFDKFFINQEVETGTISFIDQSAEWNVKLPGFGLGIVCNDFNEDGYPDLYVANDFITDDILYINKSGKGFEDQSKSLLKHTSYNSMGVDFGDINGDTKDEIMVLDMLPLTNYRQKTMLGSMNYDKFLLSQKEGYNKQYIRNTLQLHPNGVLSETNPFTDVSAYANVHKTDWSWSPLIMDFDNDGLNDIYVSNGYGKNITDLDFVNFNSNIVGFGDKEAVENKIKNEIRNLPDVKLKNQLFLNQGSTTFANLPIGKKSITNGVAYADLDDDGDLDLVQNNLNENANILINQSSANFLKINLKGTSKNINGVGAQVILTLSNGRQIKRTATPIRSYLSSMDHELVFGLGKETVKRIGVKWPDQKYIEIDTLISNETIDIVYDHHEAVLQSDEPLLPIFLSSSVLKIKQSNISQKHDFSIQSLLFKSCSNEHVKIAQLLDRDRLIVANLEKQLMQMEIESGAVQEIFDLEGRVVSDMLIQDKGLNEHPLLHVCVHDHKVSSLLIFEYKKESWSLISDLLLDNSIYHLTQSASGVLLYGTADATTYPQIDKSKMYRLHSIDDKWKLGPTIIDDYGSINKARAVDLNNDGQEEILVVGEWQQPIIYETDQNAMKSIEVPLFDSLYGFWQDVQTEDLDGDGDLDIVLSNLGLNTRLNASYDMPIELLSDDIDENGKRDPIMSFVNTYENESFTYASRDDIMSKVPKFKKHFNDYKTFAQANFKDIVSTLKPNAQFVKINFLKSIILENEGNYQFKVVELPFQSQLSISNGFEFIDVNDDGLKDMIMKSNYDAVEVHNGSIDGLNGLILINKGNCIFATLSNTELGFSIPEPIEDIIRLDDRTIVVSTSDAIRKFQK